MGYFITNFRVKGKKLYFGFVDLEKAFDRVPREVISWAMRKPVSYTHLTLPTTPYV